MSSLLLAVAALVLCGARGQSTPRSWQVIDGQPLADAVARWGISNSDVVVELAGGTIVDLRRAEFQRGANSNSSAGGRKAFSNGTLTLQGQRAWGTLSPGDTASTVIDAGMRAGLTPMLTQAFIVFSDLALVNLCLNERPISGIPAASATLLGIISLSLTIQPILQRRTINYLPRFDIASITYAQVMLRMMCPWPQVADLFVDRLNDMGALLQHFEWEVHAHELYLRDATLDSDDAVMIFRSITKENDPLMGFMRAQGLLMAPRWCDGRLAPAELADDSVDEVWGPLWACDLESEVAAALGNATALSLSQRARKLPVPCVAFFLPFVALPDSALPGSGQLNLTAPLLLVGTLAPTNVTSVLDLTARTTALLMLKEAGTLYASQLELRVPALPLLGVISPSTSTQLVSALPLTAVVDAPRSSGAAVVELSNATLVVPVLDYLALLTLATDNATAIVGVRQCMDNATLQQAAQLRPGIQVVQLGNATWSRLTLSAYWGWGVNASLLTVQPQTPVPANITQRCGTALQPTSALSSGDEASSSSSSAPVGVIVGCVVGGTAIVAIMAVLAVLWWRRRVSKACDTRPALKILPGPAGTGVAPHKDEQRDVSDGGTRSDGTPSASVALEAGARLVELLKGQEQQLVDQARTSVAPEAAGGGGDAVEGVAFGLADAHAQLIKSLVAQRRDHDGSPGAAPVVAAPGAPAPVAHALGAADAGAGSGKGAGAVDPRQSIADVAARLQAQGESPDAVVLADILGRGGSGVVYLGVWRCLPVAVKTQVFERWESSSGEAPEGDIEGGDKARGYVRAIMETAISASVGHRNVVATYHYDIKRMDDRLQLGGMQVTSSTGTLSLDAAPASKVAAVQAYKVFLVQELCTCPLRTVLQQGALHLNPNKLATIASLMHQIACGLEYLHGLGIIHGDLTPGNVLLKLDSKERHKILAKLADFGLSHRLDAHATHVSNVGSGTPFYIAPEVSKDKRLSPASDVYSFGVVAWETYAGCTPYAIMPMGVLRTNPLFRTYPGTTRPPPDVDQLINRCLHFDPRRRPLPSELVSVFKLHSEALPAPEQLVGPVIVTTPMPV